MGIAGLNSALSGLKASQQQITLISNNISNVSTPGYTRKILPQTAQTIDGIAVGVTPGAFMRNVDLNLQSDLWTQISAVENLNIQQKYLSRIDKFHGDPALNISIAAEISALRDSFSALFDSPEDRALQLQTVNQAIDTARKINDFSDLISTLRNDAQDELKQKVDRANELLQQVATLNQGIQRNLNIDRPTADLEDQRDEAIKELTGLMKITSFKRGDGVLVVQTASGQQLADQRAETLTFRPTTLGPLTYYPASAAGLYIGDPVTQPGSAIDLTTENLGGAIGGLLDLRDDIFPQQMAQLDELAHKLALRFEAQGLRLYTDHTGAIPSDDPPDTTTDPLNPVPVSYVGFSAVIRVNQAVIADNTLLQRGTYGATLDAGSAEVIHRVLNHTFTNIEYYEAYNPDATTGVDLLNTGGDDLQTWLGLRSSNQIVGSNNLSAYPDVATLIASAGGALDPPNDQFSFVFEESRTGTGPVTVTVDLSDATAGAGANALDQIVDYINTILIPSLPAGDQADLTAMGVQFSANANGQLVIDSQGSIEIDSSAGIGQTGLNFLGLTDSNGIPKAPTDPYFDVQVGNQDPVRITLEPGDTQVELLAKLNAVNGLVARLDADGFLEVRAGNDPTFADQDHGGEIRFIGGPFLTSGATYADLVVNGADRTALDNGVGIIAALFGTYEDIDPGAGVIIEDGSPITTVAYQSQTEASVTSTLHFRETLLGPGATVSTGISSEKGLIDYAQKMVNQQTQTLISIENRIEDEGSLKNLLETQFLNESGVNIDEELANLIVYQTSFAASARVLNAVNDLFDELLRAV